MGSASEPKHPLEALSESDREFVLRLVLASGSLKELAQAYGVSYPTIRAKLDRLIERLKELAAGRPREPMAELLADLIAKGEVSPSAARAVLDLHRQEMKRAKET
ncbi:MAG TPA: DUF2089 family protein [Gemmataceae bacterium]|nr:DUF2089 family protein [Gemmataceae bacterium]